MSASGTAYPTLQIKTPFYATGTIDISSISPKRFNNNRSVPDNSSDILTRNKFSVRSNNYDYVKNDFKKLHTLGEMGNKGMNNYLHPIKQVIHEEKYAIKPNQTNMGTFHRERLKLFVKDEAQDTRISLGKSVDNKSFLNKKSETSKTINVRHSLPDAPLKLQDSNFKSERSDKSIPTTYVSKVQLKENNLYFDKSLKENIKYPSGYWKQKRENLNRTKISEDAPEWLKIVNEENVKKFNEYLINNEETINIFSRYQNWITVTPKNKNRKRPLEKAKIENMEQTSKIMPKWMQIKYGQKPPNTLKSQEYNSFIENKHTMILVDKEQKEKSIFSIGDFRHNIFNSEDSKRFSSEVKQEPKNFFGWNDLTTYNPKVARDSAFIPKYKIEDQKILEARKQNEATKGATLKEPLKPILEKISS